jgi:glycosyltransferase involved in cell wall biosynthesis
VDTAGKQLAVFRSRLLPSSQTFVRDQARALQDWKALMLGFEAVPGGLSMAGLDHTIISRGHPAVFAFRALAGLPHPGLTSILRTCGARLVHAHFGTDATDVWPSVQRARLPMLVTLHGYDISIHRWWWEAGHGGRDRRAYPRRLLRMAHHAATHFIAVSERIGRRAIEFGIPPEKLSVCHIGVDTERFTPGPLQLEQRPKRVLFVGRMVEKKAPLLLIEAYSRLRKRLPEAELVMVGDGPLLSGAQLLARELGVPVEFQGVRSPAQVMENLQRARVFCLPSVTAPNGDSEGLPVSLLEAQAAGVPVITTGSGRTAEGLLPGRTGQVVPQGDIARLTDTLYLWLTDDDLARSAAPEARRLMQESFDIRVCTRQLERIYDRVAAFSP